MTQLLSLPYVSVKDLNKIYFNNINDTSFNIILEEIGEFNVEKLFIYDDDDLFNSVPIGYRLVTTCVKKLSKNINSNDLSVHIK